MRKEDIFEVIDRFEKSICTELEITDDRFSIKLSKGFGQSQSGLAEARLKAEESKSICTTDENAKETSEISEVKSVYREVKSPLVGVFYAAPKPEEAPFVAVGDRVCKGDTLCLMEAMKMMNELKSPVDGIIRAIYGKNGELAEFDEILFEVEEC